MPNSPSSINLFIWVQDRVKTEFQTEVQTLIHYLTENRTRHARGPVHTISSVRSMEWTRDVCSEGTWKLRLWAVELCSISSRRKRKWMLLHQDLTTVEIDDFHLDTKKLYFGKLYIFTDIIICKAPSRLFDLRVLCISTRLWVLAHVKACQKIFSIFALFLFSLRWNQKKWCKNWF